MSAGEWGLIYVFLGSASSKSLIEGFRPVFTLKSEIKIIGGSGVENDPYKLGA